jgi:hypothetical protein
MINRRFCYYPISAYFALVIVTMKPLSALLLALCAVLPAYSQQSLYKEALPELVSSAHARIEVGFADLKKKLDDTTFLHYFSNRNFYEMQLDETSKLYKARSYDRLQKQVSYWNEYIDRDLAEPADMPSARRAELIERLESERLDTGPVTEPVTTAFKKFIEAYTLYQRKVWMRKVTDSSKLVTELYLTRLDELQQEIDRSKVKSKLQSISGTLRSIRRYQDVVDFSVLSKSLLATLKSARPYLDDEFFYQFTLKQKINANWKPENVVDFGTAMFEALVSGNQKAYARHFLSFSDAQEIYSKKIADYNQQHYDQALEQALASFKQVTTRLQQEGIVPGTIQQVSDYVSDDYMNSITAEQRKTYPLKYDIYILFESPKGRYLLTLNEVDNSSLKHKIRHLSTLELTKAEGL